MRSPPTLPPPQNLERTLGERGGNKTIFHFNLQSLEACLAKIKNFPLFYQQLIQIWAKVSKHDPIQTSDPAYEICKEVLWNKSPKGTNVCADQVLL